MFEGLIEQAVLKAKSRIGVDGVVIACLALAGLLALMAIVFLSVALYNWLASLYGGALAALAVGLLYLALAGILVWCGVAARRRNQLQARQQLALAAAARAQSFALDPKLLKIAYEIGKTIGWRRLLPIAAAGVGLIVAMTVARGRDKDTATEQPPQD